MNDCSEAGEGGPYVSNLKGHPVRGHISEEHFFFWGNVSLPSCVDGIVDHCGPSTLSHNAAQIFFVVHDIHINALPKTLQRVNFTFALQSERSSSSPSKCTSKPITDMKKWLLLRLHPSSENVGEEFCLSAPMRGDSDQPVEEPQMHHGSSREGNERDFDGPCESVILQMTF